MAINPYIIDGLPFGGLNSIGPNPNGYIQVTDV